MAKTLSKAVGTVLGRIQTNWFFRDRTWTTKRYSEYDNVDDLVSVHEKSTSPAYIIQAWAFFCVIFGFSILLWLELIAQVGNSTGGTVTAMLGIPIAAVLSAACLGFAGLGVIRWIDAHVTDTRCTQCNASVTYPHTFSEGGLGNKNTFKFCSKDCREQWEREYVEYPFSGYYDIQDEETERRVEYEDYSSAYEVIDD